MISLLCADFTRLSIYMLLVHLLLIDLIAIKVTSIC